MNSTSTTYTVKSNSNKPISLPIQYGWRCPSCGAVMAPWQSSCINCSGTYQPSCTPMITWGDSTKAPEPWWNHVTCCDASKNSECTVTAWSSGNTTSNSLKNALKSNGINI